MANIEFKRFTQRDVLAAIAVKHLAQFFERFECDLRDRKLPIPYAPAGTEPFYNSWLELLTSPETLPGRLVEAILAIEQMAAPENRPRLEAALREARVANPWLDPKDSPECLALQLWLLTPYGKLAKDQSATDSGNAPANQPSPVSAASVARPVTGRVSPSAPSQMHDHNGARRERHVLSSTRNPLRSRTLMSVQVQPFKTIRSRRNQAQAQAAVHQPTPTLNLQLLNHRPALHR